MVSFLFLVGCQWWTSRSKANPAEAHPGGLGQNGHPRLSWLLQTSFSSKINSKYFSAMGLEQHCLQELPARTRNAHVWFILGGSYNHRRSLRCNGPVSLNTGTEGLSPWVVPGWTRGYLPLYQPSW